MVPETLQILIMIFVILKNSIDTLMPNLDLQCGVLGAIMVIDRVVGDWSWSGEGLSWKGSFLNFLCKFIYNSFKLTEHLK